MQTLFTESATDYILCRLCGADLASPKKIINHLSPEATVVVNQTLFERKGVEVQLLTNPLGIKFHSIALSDSKCPAVHNVSIIFLSNLYCRNRYFVIYVNLPFSGNKISVGILAMRGNRAFVNNAELIMDGIYLLMVFFCIHKFHL